VTQHSPIFFFNNFNNQHQFTKELEAYSSFAFLDAFIEKFDIGIKTSTYNETHHYIPAFLPNFFNFSPSATNAI